MQDMHFIQFFASGFKLLQHSRKYEKKKLECLKIVSRLHKTGISTLSWQLININFSISIFRFSWQAKNKKQQKIGYFKTDKKSHVFMSARRC